MMQEVTESEFSIYDTDDILVRPTDSVKPVRPTIRPVKPTTQQSFMSNMDMDNFPDMPIFSNFPMMKPHEFINLIASEDISKIEEEEKEE